LHIDYILKVPRYLGILPTKFNRFRLLDFHHLWFRFPADSTINWIFDLATKLQPHLVRPLNPEHTTSADFTICSV
jgi:hypothetical protein